MPTWTFAEHLTAMLFGAILNGSSPTNAHPGTREDLHAGLEQSGMVRWVGQRLSAVVRLNRAGEDEEE